MKNDKLNGTKSQACEMVKPLSFDTKALITQSVT